MIKLIDLSLEYGLIHPSIHTCMQDFPTDAKDLIISKCLHKENILASKMQGLAGPSRSRSDYSTVKPYYLRYQVREKTTTVCENITRAAQNRQTLCTYECKDRSHASSPILFARMAVRSSSG